MNKQDANAMLLALKDVDTEERFVIMEWLKCDLHSPSQPPFPEQPDSMAAMTRIFGTTSSVPWGPGDDTFDEVIEALSCDTLGYCDACGKYTALRHYDSSSGETDQCLWGCE